MYTNPNGAPELHPIKQVMHDRGITVRSVAKHLELPENYVSRLLNNRLRVTPAIRIKVSALFDLPESELFLADPPRPNRRLLVSRVRT